jgi:CheY-like chemotaxis protein
VNPESRPGGNLTEIRRAGERARDVVNQVLTFARRREAHRTRICIKALAAEIKSLLADSLPVHIGLVVRATAQPTLVSGEPGQLQQVILNLCTNAAQAMDAAGSIEIGIEARNIRHALRIGHGELAPGGYAVISVTDPGRGMDGAVLEQIFEPFFTTRADGNGLGLATVREIVLEHGGAVQAQSAPGAGTRFDIWLPLAPLEPPLSAHETCGSVGRGGGQTVLLLEADRERLLRHEEILAALGYEPVGFANPAEASAACVSAPTRFDAALLCCHLHESRTALEHAAALRRSAPGLPVILATGSARELGAPTLADAGICEVIRQPLMSGELASALARRVSVPTPLRPT